MARTVAFALAISLVTGSLIFGPRPAEAASVGAAPTVPGPRAPGKPLASPPHAGRPPGGSSTPRATTPRHPHSYATCNRLAQARKLRGADRRHFVARCQLGYGRPLFRRRGHASHA